MGWDIEKKEKMFNDNDLFVLSYISFSFLFTFYNYSILYFYFILIMQIYFYQDIERMFYKFKSKLHKRRNYIIWSIINNLQYKSRLN